MNTKDLEIFIVLAETRNMQKAATQCEKAPSVISKSLKRLELELGVQLFDRVGKYIELNSFGAKFRVHAAKILAQAKQSINECSGLSEKQLFRIAAPPIVLFRWANVVSKSLLEGFPRSIINFNTVYEHEALTQVIEGQSDGALITSAIKHLVPKDMHVMSFGQLIMKIAAARNHDLLAEVNISPGKYSTSIADITEYAFVAPSVSPFCGEHRGIGCDGWPNELHPRHLSIAVNDYGVLGQLVKSGQVLAYLPDFWIRELALVEIELVDKSFEAVEQILFISYQQQLLDCLNGDTTE